jgi:hypothetical protein
MMFVMVCKNSAPSCSRTTADHACGAALLPGHGLFCLSGGAWHVRRCADAFAAGLVPKQLHYFA